jgi:hypothetical protein
MSGSYPYPRWGVGLQTLSQTSSFLTNKLSGFYEVFSCRLLINFRSDALRHVQRCNLTLSFSTLPYRTLPLDLGLDLDLGQIGKRLQSGKTIQQKSERVLCIAVVPNASTTSLSSCLCALCSNLYVCMCVCPCV